MPEPARHTPDAKPMANGKSDGGQGPEKKKIYGMVTAGAISG